MTGMTLVALKASALACACGALGLTFWVLVGRPGAPLSRLFAEEVDELDGRLRRLLLAPQGTNVALGQALVAALIFGLAIAAWDPFVLAALPIPFALPRVVLGVLERNRRKRLDESADGFALSVANALQANPSLPKALATAHAAMPQPLRGELELTLRDLRLGTTAEQALNALGARTSTASLDAVLSAILLGGRVGGNLPEILRNTSATLREMSRLHAVMRTKTADARIQGVVLALFPAVIVVLFDAVMPGYFAPLVQSSLGHMMIFGAAVAWLVAIVLARKILAIEL